MERNAAAAIAADAADPQKNTESRTCSIYLEPSSPSVTFQDMGHNELGESPDVSRRQTRLADLSSWGPCRLGSVSSDVCDVQPPQIPYSVLLARREWSHTSRPDVTIAMSDPR